MAKTVIEEDYRGIIWAEDCSYPKPNIPQEAVSNYLKALTFFCKNASQEDRAHYFTIIDGNNVKIIPASKYNKAPA